MRAEPREPTDQCFKCGGGVFYRLRGVWVCLTCEGLSRCPVPTRWIALPLEGPRASRRARFLARRMHLDLEDIPGSGYKGKIVEADVLEAGRRARAESRRAREREEHDG